MDFDQTINTPQEGDLGELGTDLPMGQHTDEPIDKIGEPKDDTKTPPVKPGLFKDLGDAEQQYKDLQSKFNERDDEIRQSRQDKDDAVAQFKDVGGMEAAAKYIKQLSTDPSFRKWAEERRDVLAGVKVDGDEGLSAAEKEGLKIVRNMNQQEIADFKQRELDPLKEQIAELSLDRSFALMDKEHPNWREQQAKMEELSKYFDPTIQENPSFKHIELLYKAARADSTDLKTPEQLQQEIAEKHKKATGDAQIPGEQGLPQGSGSIEDCFNQALKLAH